MPYAAVGAAVLNPNPDTLVSWADFLMGYGHWMPPIASGEMDMLPGHNGSFKRAALLRFGDELAALIEIEIAVQARLRAAGEKLYLESRAQFYHLNFSRYRTWLPAIFVNGRVYAAGRRREWSALKRLIYAGGSFLIPLVRIGRIRQDVRDPAQQRALFPRIVPVLLLGLFTSAMGEMFGYALGSGRASRDLVRYEFNRVRDVRPSDLTVASIESTHESA